MGWERNRTATVTSTSTVFILLAFLLTPRGLSEPQNGGRTSVVFDVASIKPSAPAEEGMTVQFYPGGRFIARNAPLRMLIKMAYHIHDYQLSGGPRWLDSERYDVVAKGEDAATQDQLRLMLRALLTQRFKLLIQPEQRELSVYALVVAKGGPKLQATKYKGSAPGAGFRLASGHVDAVNSSMSELADLLSGRLDRTVVDKTGIAGTFDFEIDWQEDLDQESFKPSIFAAMQEQLGLRLEPQKGVVQTFAVLHAERPSEN